MKISNAVFCINLLTKIKKANIFYNYKQRNGVKMDNGPRLKFNELIIINSKRKIQTFYKIFFKLAIHAPSHNYKH